MTTKPRMTLAAALAFATSSALEAIDQKDAYVDSVGSYRQNLRDTLKDERGAEHEAAAFEAYDAQIAQLTATADPVAELLAALQAIVDEAGPNFGRDDGLGSINRMSRIARLAIAKVTGA